MDVQYTPKGPKGKTCADCVHYKPDKKSTRIGMCFGHGVIAAGSCNFFKKK